MTATADHNPREAYLGRLKVFAADRGINPGRSYEGTDQGKHRVAYAIEKLGELITEGGENSLRVEVGIGMTVAFLRQSDFVPAKDAASLATPEGRIAYYSNEAYLIPGSTVTKIMALCRELGLAPIIEYEEKVHAPDVFRIVV